MYCGELNLLCSPMENIINDMLNLPRCNYFIFNYLYDNLIVTFNVDIPKSHWYCNLKPIANRSHFCNHNRGCPIEKGPILRGLLAQLRRMNPPAVEYGDRDPSKLSLITPAVESAA